MAAVLPNAAAPASVSGLARALAQAGRLTAQQVDALHRKAQADKLAFIDVLLESGHLDAPALAAFCSETFGYPLLDLTTFSLNYLPESIIDAKSMQKQRAVALGKRGNKVAVAISDPTNTHALDQIKFQTEMAVEPVIVEHPALLQLIEKLNQTA